MELARLIASSLEQALALRSTPVPQAVAIMGRNCHMPNALTTPLHVVLHVEATAGHATPELSQAHAGAANGDGVGASLEEAQYTRAVRLALREGGCCASRASYVGACMGALLGRNAVPQSWLARYVEAARVQAWAATVVGLRDA